MTGNDPRCYLATEVMARLKMTRRTFYRLKRLGQLPFIEELSPRLGHMPRYRADLVDQYLANRWPRMHFKKGA